MGTADPHHDPPAQSSGEPAHSGEEPSEHPPAPGRQEGGDERADAPKESSEERSGIRPEFSPATAEEEELPEWEELTPELLEDECLRGDVMLRWGAVLLAVLLGWTYITETNVLVQVRSGEYLVSHGWLPPRTDVFSSTAGDRPWVNLSWLSDILLGLLSHLGLAALSVLTAVTAFMAFQFLTRTGISGVTTWWGSICAAAAAVAVFPVLQPGSTSFTVLGLAILMWLIQGWREPKWRGRPQETGERAGRTPDLRSSGYLLPVLFLVWSNLDPRAFLGLIVLVGFAAGETVMGSPRGKGASGLGRLWLLTLASGLAMMVHPWHWHALESAWIQLTVVPAEIRAYIAVSEFLPRWGESYLQPSFWRRPDLFLDTAAGLGIVALLTQLLNFRRFDAGLCLAWLAAIACGAASGEMLVYSAVVSAAVATICGQDWYRHNFSTDFAVETWTVLYSRAGRALTVLAFFAVAYLAVNGTLMQPDGRRIGTGLDPRWKNRLESLQDSIVEEAFDQHTFPLRVDQGDLLLWLGQKPFVDSRLSLYAARGENLLALHRATRAAIRFGEENAPVVAESVDWREVLDRYDVTHVVARLWGPLPDYDTFLVLLLQPQWAMTGLGSAGAAFYRTDLDDPELNEYIQEHVLNDFVEPAFREVDPETAALARPDFPRVKSDYQRWLIQPLPAVPPAIELAQHYVIITSALRNQLRPEQALALGYLALRSARQGLVQDPNQPQGWRAIQQAQSILLSVESQLYGQPPVTAGIRSTPALNALVNAVHASGSSPADLEQLAEFQLGAQRLAVSLQLFQRLQARLGGRLTRIPADDPASEEEETRRQDLLEQLEMHVAEVRDQVAQAIESGASPAQAAMTAIRSNCPLVAVEVLEKDLTAIANDPSAQLLYAGLLLEVGRTEEAWQRVESMESMMPQPPVPPEAAGIVGEWYRLDALVNVAVGDLDRAALMYRRSLELRTRIALGGLVRQPFASAATPAEQDLWPAIMSTATMNAAVDFPEQWSALMFSRALMEIEQGRVEQASRLLRTLLDEHPEWSQRVLAVYYLSLLTGEEIPLAPPSDQIPITPDMFAPDEAPASDEDATGSDPT